MPTALIPFVWMAITAANPLPRPLNTFEILTLLIGGVTPERIEGLMRQRGSTCGVGAAGGLVGGLLQDLGGGNRLAEACQNPSPEMTAKFNKFYGLKEFEPLMNDDVRLQQMRQDMLDHRQMAVKDFRARLEANPRNSAVRIALAYVISSPILLSPPDKNSLESAVALLRDGIRLEPGEPRLHYWLGVLLNGPWLVAPPPPPPPGQPPPPESQQRRDEITGALAELNEAVKLKPDYAAAQCLLEGIYSNEGDYDDALVHGSECVRLKPGDVDARMEFAMTFESKGDCDGMASELTKAIQLNYRKPKSLQVVYWDEMFFGFRVTQCRDSLISSLRNALPSVPADRQWQLGEMLARYLANQGATDEAIEEYRRCLTGGHLAARDEARLRGSLAELLYQKGDKKSALAEYRQAFLLDPGNPDFKQAYDKVLNELNSH